MHVELEAKFLDIDKDDFRSRLHANGARLIHPERLMRRRTLEHPIRRLSALRSWVRVRDEGDKVTLAYKEVADRTLKGTKEISLVVDSFDTAMDFLVAIGMEVKSYQETKRERWDCHGVEVTIDTWPWIPAFVELEAENEHLLRETAFALGLDWAAALHGSVEVAYQAYYDVTEAEIDDWAAITFGSVPESLDARRR
jgi:adenylate cyclase, class 2